VAELAERLGILRALVPPDPGLLSAYGMLAAPPMREVSRTLLLSTDDPDLESRMDDALRTLEDRAVQEMTAEGNDPGSLAVGYWVPRLCKLSLRQSIAIGMEIGIHNGTLAIALALSPMLLNNATMSIPAAIYSIIMFFTAAAFGWWVNFAHGKELRRGE
jgi:predicted Na+-dependent transporter